MAPAACPSNRPAAPLGTEATLTAQSYMMTSKEALVYMPADMLGTKLGIGAEVDTASAAARPHAATHTGSRLGSAIMSRINEPITSSVRPRVVRSTLAGNLRSGTCLCTMMRHMHADSLADTSEERMVRQPACKLHI